MATPEITLSIKQRKWVIAPIFWLAHAAIFFGIPEERVCQVATDAIIKCGFRIEYL